MNIYGNRFSLKCADQDDNAGSQDRSWRKKLQGGPREQRHVGNSAQTETRTAGAISDKEEWQTLTPDPGNNLVEIENVKGDDNFSR